MRVLGIVAEYNPFHNGHLYQLQKAKSICSPDATIVIMSGNFTQRGEPAIVDKWTRARIALLNGADLVFELPFVCATSSADFFARGAVSILCGTGILTHISFGSEDPDVGKIRQMAAVLSEEPESFRAALKEELDGGAPYARAVESALRKYLNADPSSDLLASPNLILAVQYIKSLIELGHPAEIIPVKRIGADYHESIVPSSGSSGIASATGIRTLLTSGEADRGMPIPEGQGGNRQWLSPVQPYIPSNAADILEAEINRTGGPMTWRQLEPSLLTLLRRNPELYTTAPGCGEGLDNRLRAAAETARSIDELLCATKTRRYHFTRLQRLLLHLLIGLDSASYDEIRTAGLWRYARVLGFNGNGRKALSAMGKTAEIPVITRLASLSAEDPIFRSLRYDIAATDIYTANYGKAAARNPRRDYREVPVVV